MRLTKLVVSARPAYMVLGRSFLSLRCKTLWVGAPANTTATTCGSIGGGSGCCGGSSGGDGGGGGAATLEGCVDGVFTLVVAVAATVATVVVEVGGGDVLQGAGLVDGRVEVVAKSGRHLHHDFVALRCCWCCCCLW